MNRRRANRVLRWCRRALGSTSMAVLLTCLSASGAPATQSSATQTAGHFRLTILHNNDGESQLLDAGSKLRDFGGVARFATLVQQLKQQALTGADTVQRGVIMLSSGDNFLAGPIFQASLTRGVPFFDSLALDLIGYDAIAIGNHEFDFGPDVFADFIIGMASTPLVSANLTFHDEPRLHALVKANRIVRATVVEANGERLGIVGATTPQLPYISSPRQVAVDDRIAAAVQAEVQALTAQGINKIILINHLQGIDEDLALVPQLRGVDVVVAGGGEELLASAETRLLPGDTAQRPYPLMATDADGKSLPVVTTRGGYRYVGRLIVEFDADGAVVAIDEASGPVRVAGGKHEDAVEPHPLVQAQVTKPVQQAIKALASHVIGRTAVALDGRRRSVRTQETNVGNLVADAVLSQATRLAAPFGLPQPAIALHNGGGIRNDAVIAPGALTALDTFGILPFPNFVTIVPRVPAVQVEAILENAVSRIERTDGRFAQIAGFHMCWTPTGTPQQLDKQGNVVTPGTRVQEVTLADGTPIIRQGLVVAGAPAITIATINFLARGGDQYPFHGAPFTSLGVSAQQALVNYITQDLQGMVTAATYPTDGEGRIHTLSTEGPSSQPASCTP